MRGSLIAAFCCLLLSGCVKADSRVNTDLTIETANGPVRYGSVAVTGQPSQCIAVVEKRHLQAAQEAAFIELFRVGLVDRIAKALAEAERDGCLKATTAGGDKQLGVAAGAH